MMELYRKLAVMKKELLLLDSRPVKLKSHSCYTRGQNLVPELREMVNNPECSDVTFKCEDGQCVQASRMFLVAKCPVLKSMLSNGMAESKQSEIALPQVSSDAFLVVLKFLYTGEVWEEDLKLSILLDQDARAQDDGPMHAFSFPPFSLDWGFIFRVLKAARFFLLDQLESLMAKRLWPDLPRHILHTEETINQATERLPILCSSIRELNVGFTGKVLCFMLLQLIRIMFEHDLSVAHLRNLSFQCMHVYLFNTRSLCKDETWRLSFPEYMKLWRLLTWCINSTLDKNALCKEAYILTMVEPKRAASALLHPPEQKKLCEELTCLHSLLRQKFVARLQRGNFERLKGFINLVCIHPELLICIVEPLGIFSSTELSEVLRDQLVRASRWRKRIEVHDRKCQWRVMDAHISQLATDYSLPSGKLAVGTLAMWCHYAYEWEIVQSFERLRANTLWGASDPSFVLEVGFLSSVPGESIECSRLSESRKGWALKVQTDGVAFFANGKKVSEGQLSGIRPPPMETKSNKMGVYRVRLKLDRNKKTFSFSFGPDGQERHLVCDNLWTGLLFPAVYVSYDGKRLKGETRIDLSQGFQFSEDVEFNVETAKRRKVVADSGDSSQLR